jgi:phosphoribosylformylglycinamidine cyclo-ligase
LILLTCQDHFQYDSHMPRLTYKKAGVDIHAGQEFVHKIRRMARSTQRPEVVSPIGGFGGMFQLDTRKLKNPILVSSTDGVGTKLKVAHLMDRHETVGIDLVAMCVNDVIVTGADPLFFLDYIAMGKLKHEIPVNIVRGIVKGCKIAGCSLIGGETAEMPSFYSEGVYDLAGFAVGIVEKRRMIDGKRIKSGDVLVGLPSSGLHSNGYSLARKVIFETIGLKISDRLPGSHKTIGEELLTPTRIYVKIIKETLKRIKIKGLAHITGGGFTGNVPRILPQGLSVRVRLGSWPVPGIFKYLADKGSIASDEMYRVFNMGIGMVMVVSPSATGQLMRILSRLGEKAYIMGEVVRSGKMNRVFYA